MNEVEKKIYQSTQIYKKLDSVTEYCEPLPTASVRYK